MSDSDTEQARVPTELLFTGLEKAYDRLLDAGANHDDAFHALFEALNWLVSLDDRFSAERGKRADWLDDATKGYRPNGPAAGTVALKALRYARNSVHHQWADALYWAHGAEVPTPLERGRLPGEWRWKPDIPPPRNPNGRKEHQRTMAGRSVRDSIQHVAAVLGVNAHLVGCGVPSWIVGSDEHRERQ